jgi:antitoxin (DNA-binding transcriptional repressor) of toxin-antitoxin stability system
VTTLTATEVARNFSHVLNRVAAGEEIEIVRNGAPIAVLSAPRARTLPASRLRALLQSLPPVDEDFAEDLRRIRRESGYPEDPWPS